MPEQTAEELSFELFFCLGGGLLLPLFILLLAFTPHDASPLTNVTVLGGAVANLGFYYGRKHPSKRKPLIAFEVALMMEPMTMAGAIAGVMMNKIFPGWLITLLLVLILGLTTHRTLDKGLRMWRKESATAARPDAADPLLLRLGRRVRGVGARGEGPSISAHVWYAPAAVSLSRRARQQCAVLLDRELRCKRELKLARQRSERH